MECFLNIHSRLWYWMRLLYHSCNIRQQLMLTQISPYDIDNQDLQTEQVYPFLIIKLKTGRPILDRRTVDGYLLKSMNIPALPPAHHARESHLSIPPAYPIFPLHLSITPVHHTCPSHLSITPVRLTCLYWAAVPHSGLAFKGELYNFAHLPSGSLGRWQLKNRPRVRLQAILNIVHVIYVVLFGNWQYN